MKSWTNDLLVTKINDRLIIGNSFCEILNKNFMLITVSYDASVVLVLFQESIFKRNGRAFATASPEKKEG